jgi:flagella basal body P-ring formation protein FlgA
VAIQVDSVPVRLVLARFEMAVAAATGRGEKIDAVRIRRNEPVAVRVESGPIVIQSEGYALNDAVTGDLVRVRRSGSNDVLTGRLLASGAVAIHER